MQFAKVNFRCSITCRFLTRRYIPSECLLSFQLQIVSDEWSRFLNTFYLEALREKRSFSLSEALVCYLLR